MRRKKKKKIKPFWKVIILFKLVVLILVGLTYAVIYSNLLTVNSINFEGSGYYSDEFLKASIVTQVLEEKKLLTFLGSNNILFWIFSDDKGEIEISHRIPYIEKITVDIDLFKKNVSIQTEERTVFGVICNDDCFAFDENGLIFSEAPSVKGSLILRVDDPDNNQIIIGSTVFSRNIWGQNVFEIFSTIRENNFNPTKVTLKSSELREFDITLSSGLVFNFSLEFVPEDFSNVLKAVNRKLEVEDISYIDFRVPGRIYYQ